MTLLVSWGGGGDRGGAGRGEGRVGDIFHRNNDIHSPSEAVVILFFGYQRMEQKALCHVGTQLTQCCLPQHRNTKIKTCIHVDSDPL